MERKRLRDHRGKLETNPSLIDKAEKLKTLEKIENYQWWSNMINASRYFTDDSYYGRYTPQIDTHQQLRCKTIKRSTIQKHRIPIKNNELSIPYKIVKYLDIGVPLKKLDFKIYLEMKAN